MGRKPEEQKASYPANTPHVYVVQVESLDKNEDFQYVQNRLESLRCVSQEDP